MDARLSIRPDVLADGATIVAVRAEAVV